MLTVIKANVKGSPEHDLSTAILRDALQLLEMGKETDWLQAVTKIAKQTDYREVFNNDWIVASIMMGDFMRPYSATADA